MADLNLQDILDMFQNGERRYAEDPAFKAAVDSLKMGLGVYAVLDHVLKDNARLNGLIVSHKEYIGVLETDTLKLRNEIEERKFAYAKLQSNIVKLNDELRDLKVNGHPNSPGGRENY